VKGVRTVPKAISQAPQLTVIPGGPDVARAAPPKPVRRRRPRGEGTVYTTKHGRIRAATLVDDPETGQRKRLVASGRTQGEARSKLADAVRDFESGRGPSQTFEAYLGRWLPALRARVRPSSWAQREQHCRLHIAPAFGKLALSDLTPGHVERLTARLVAGGLSPTTAHHIRTTIGMVLRDAQRDGLVARNVALLARPPRAIRPELHVLTADQTRRLLAAVADDEFGPAITMAATTGLRQGELLGLAWADVDIESSHPTLVVRRTLAKASGTDWVLSEPKTRRSRRTLELAPRAVAALAVQRARQDAMRVGAGDLWQDVAGLVFTDALGRPLRPWDVTKAFRAALARHGLPKVRFHDLRHGAASMMLAAGVPMKLVSDALGHSTIAITADVYSHLDREQRRAAATAIENALGGGAA
jgi:integrase